METTILYRVIEGYMGFIWGLYRENGKEHANYYKCTSCRVFGTGFRTSGLGLRV